MFAGTPNPTTGTASGIPRARTGSPTGRKIEGGAITDPGNRDNVSGRIIDRVKAQLRVAIHFLHWRREDGDIVDLPGHDDVPDRQAFRVGACVDLDREAATRTAECVAPDSPFRRLRIGAPG